MKKLTLHYMFISIFFLQIHDMALWSIQRNGHSRTHSSTSIRDHAAYYEKGNKKKKMLLFSELVIDNAWDWLFGDLPNNIIHFHEANLRT